MVQTYPKYEADSVFGLIATSKCNVRASKDGKYLFSGGLECVLMWNIRQVVIVKIFDDVSCVKKYESCYLELSPDEREVAIGYTNGSIKIYSIATGSMKIHFSGHDAAITVLRYDESGMRLVSGSRDNDLVIWDIPTESGVNRLFFKFCFY